MDEERRRTIETLVDLAQPGDEHGCWDAERAENLLRTQSSADELRALGVDEAFIHHLWAERNEG